MSIRPIGSTKLNASAKICYNSNDDDTDNNTNDNHNIQDSAATIANMMRVARNIVCDADSTNIIY